MKLSPEIRQKQYEYRRDQLVRVLNTEPLKSVTSRYNSRLTEQLVAGWCAGILEAVHGGPIRAVLWMLRRQFTGFWAGIKGSLWRFWQRRIRGKSNNELWAMIVSEGHDPNCAQCKGKGEYVASDGEMVDCDCYVE
ncbi:MAG: hypothetical protein AB1631_34605 [Acidobacteriota bacterium]